MNIFSGKIIILYALWNLAVFLVYGLDKKKAIDGKWRIPEKTLISMAFLFGGVGAYLGMKCFRHKTKHTNFRILVPFAAILNIAALWWFLKNTNGGIF